jgi:hypothetical protein
MTAVCNVSVGARSFAVKLPIEAQQLRIRLRLRRSGNRAAATVRHGQYYIGAGTLEQAGF